MKYLYTALIPSIVLLLTACSGADSVSPDAPKATIRFYNGNIGAARMEINDRELFGITSPGNVSDRAEVEPSSDSSLLRVLDGPTNAILAQRTALIKPLHYSAVLFPATSVYNCTRLPETCILQEDASAPPGGRTRLRVINATTDGLDFSLQIDDMEVLKNRELALRSISNIVDIEAGEHKIVLMRTDGERYAAAYRVATLKTGVTYTLLLTGSLSFEDNTPFRARLYSDADPATDVSDLYIPPDVGKFQIVHAVTGLKSLEARLNGAARPETAKIEFSKSSGYVDLEIGSHTTSVFGNGTPLIQETRTVATLRSRKTLFVTGSMVPPNLAGIELADPVTPLSTSSATVRFLNLSPDAPALDFYRIVNGVEAIIDGSAMLAFRQATSTANGTQQFTELPAGRITILAKKANTQTVVLQPTQITLLPGEVSTLWLGGLSATAQLYHVKHN